MKVKVYQGSKYSLRITVPKSIYGTFAQAYSQLSYAKVGSPYLLLRLGTKYLNTIKPHFDNCDLGLEMYLGKPDLRFLSSVGPFGKTNFGFTINARVAGEIGISAGMTLECEILPNTKPSANFYSKIIGYRIV